MVWSRAHYKSFFKLIQYLKSSEASLSQIIIGVFLGKLNFFNFEYKKNYLNSSSHIQT